MAIDSPYCGMGFLDWSERNTGVGSSVWMERKKPFRLHPGGFESLMKSHQGPGEPWVRETENAECGVLKRLSVCMAE